jgi:hypothetical protein
VYKNAQYYVFKVNIIRFRLLEFIEMSQTKQIQTHKFNLTILGKMTLLEKKNKNNSLGEITLLINTPIVLWKLKVENVAVVQSLLELVSLAYLNTSIIWM